MVHRKLSNEELVSLQDGSEYDVFIHDDYQSQYSKQTLQRAYSTGSTAVVADTLSEETTEKMKMPSRALTLEKVCERLEDEQEEEIKSENDIRGKTYIQGMYQSTENIPSI